MIVFNFDKNKEKNLNINDVFSWYGLPALVVENNMKIVFSSINGKLKTIELPLYENETFYQRANEIGFFNCLKVKNKRQNKLTVVMSITERCNNKCRYCFLDATKLGKDMDIDMAYAVIDAAISLARGRILNLAFFGGEPTVNFDLVKKSVAYLDAHPQKNELKGIEYTITTNGVFNDDVLHFLINKKFNVSLSMDGIPQVQEYHRPLFNGASNISIVEKNLTELAKFVNLKIRATVTRFSVDKMVETTEWLAQHGVKKIHFGPVTPGGRGATDIPALQPPSAQDFAQNLIKSIKIGKHLNVDIICFPYMNAMYAPLAYCDGNINNRVVITPAGIVTSCVEVQSKEHPLYEAFNLGYYDEDMKKIFLTAQKRRSAQKQGCEGMKRNKTKCQTCPLLFFCGGGCPTRNYRGSGNTENIDDYRCEITQRVMPFILRQYYEATYKKI